MSPDMLLAGGLGAVALAILLTVTALAPARAPQRGVGRALAAIEHRYGRAPARSGAAAASDRLAALPGWLRRLAERLSPAGLADSLQARLDVAGNPPGWTAERILTVKGLGLLGVGGLAGLWGLPNPASALLAAAVGGAAGFFLPDLLLYNAGSKRQEAIRNALPDALDMMTVCVEAGLGFDAALAQVARNTEGPLAAEFARALQEMQIGRSRGEALGSLVDRGTVDEVRTFVTALVQAGELGISIARVLREQAHQMRLRRRQRAEEKAQQVPVKILFPLISCLFPALFVVVIGPGAISIMESLFR